MFVKARITGQVLIILRRKEERLVENEVEVNVIGSMLNIPADPLNQIIFFISIHSPHPCATGAGVWRWYRRLLLKF